MSGDNTMDGGVIIDDGNVIIDPQTANEKRTNPYPDVEIGERKLTDGWVSSGDERSVRIAKGVCIAHNAQGIQIRCAKCGGKMRYQDTRGDGAVARSTYQCVSCCDARGQFVEHRQGNASEVRGELAVNTDDIPKHVWLNLERPMQCPRCGNCDMRGFRDGVSPAEADEQYALYEAPLPYVYRNSNDSTGVWCSLCKWFTTKQQARQTYKTHQTHSPLLEKVERIPKYRREGFKTLPKMKSNEGVHELARVVVGDEEDAKEIEEQMASEDYEGRPPSDLHVAVTKRRGDRHRGQSWVVVGVREMNSIKGTSWGLRSTPERLAQLVLQYAPETTKEVDTEELTVVAPAPMD